jgi:hypothetical protein
MTILSDQLSAEDIRKWPVEPLPRNRAVAMQRARANTEHAGCGGPGQQLGERWPVGCVALEITQRCNLDCTLCYLSEHSRRCMIYRWKRSSGVQIESKITLAQVSMCK